MLATVGTVMFLFVVAVIVTLAVIAAVVLFLGAAAGLTTIIAAVLNLVRQRTDYRRRSRGA